MSTQLIGFSIGGIGRRFLVDPPSMKFSDVQRTIRLPTGIPLPGLEGIFTGDEGLELLSSTISTRGSYDNTGKSYNVTRIIDSRNNLDVEAYKAYSPIFLSATFATSYGLSFAAITATLTHAFLFYGKQIWTQARRSLHEQPDIHARLMSRYEQVPEWYYAVIFVSMFIFSIISIEALETDLPVWGFILALSISFMYVIPCGMIQAVTNQQVGLNVIAELVVGYALPGRPVAMMLFKTWGYITMAQASGTVVDVFQYRRYLRPSSEKRFCVSKYRSIRDGVDYMGSHRSRSPVLKRSNLLSPGANNFADVLSAALDAGVAIGAILVFFCLQYPLNGSIGNNTIQKWWGNTVFYGTADYLGTPLKALKDDGSRFGPSSW
ncbi:Sexual differentiation process protein isp4 [Psilocybe cubensis]|uniref:Sexual differentiation process protein isp4 n=1 Tax=Psilocybe cubensis TaxID=181762 RepID=A0ACB8GIM6_PSICU|nr:Sexual differentiation process protein isp4 [Psilocybe cubensis]KAH9475570.1 Sexual differentiation process protein isp4 [Psilocybe cubensis]